MKKQILLVDDEVEIVNFLERFLNRMQISSVKALSGKQALEIYKKDSTDVVFLDAGLKDMSGFDVLKELKEYDPLVKAVMVTGRFDRESENKAMALGAIDFIRKPLDLAELREKINTYILH